MNSSVEKLLRKTRRRLFFTRWFSATIQFYFYAFFTGTALILFDRIAGELEWWSPYSLERLILISILVTFVAGAGCGAVVAWRERRTMKELAWLIDRACGTGALLVTALESDEVRVDEEWRTTIERKANQLSGPLLSRTLIRWPRQGIRWLFLGALLIDLFMVGLLTPRHERKRPEHRQQQQQQVNARGGQTKASTGGNGSARDRGASSGGKNKKKNELSGKNGSGKSSNKKRSPENRPNQPDQNTSRSAGPPEQTKGASKLYGPEKRHEHQRRETTVRRKAENGPLRDGLVRMFDVERGRKAGGSSEKEKTESEGEGQGSNPTRQPDQTEQNERRRARAIYRNYRRKAEKMIRNRSLSPDDRELVRQYFEAIRPE